MNYPQTIDYLFAKLPMFQRIGDKAFKKDLGNTIALLDSLQNPHNKFPSVHIAGTNGKGSVTHIIASVLQKAGYKVGCYTSPHYKDFRERIKINGEFIDEQSVIDFVSKMQAPIESIQPSFFEITVAMAFDFFAKEKVDIAIIETGMGGRFDSTNVITPLLSVITNISFDHQTFLGDTLPKIAFEKAGIIKAEIPVIIGEYHEETHEVFENKAMEMDSAFFYAHELFEIQDFKTNIYGSEFSSYFGKRILHYKTDLSGAYQKKNLQTSLAALSLIQEHFPHAKNALLEGLESVQKSTYFIGRSMVLQENPLILADSAHNEAGILELIQILASQQYEHLHFVYGTVADKDLSTVLPHLPKNASYYFCKADIPRGMNAQELCEKAKDYSLNGNAYSSVQAAFEAAKKAQKSRDLVLVSGSIFIVAEVL